MAILDTSILSNSIAREVASSGDTKLKDDLVTQRQRYDEKQKTVESRTKKIQAEAGTGGLQTDLANRLVGAPRGVAPVGTFSSGSIGSQPNSFEIGSGNVSPSGTFISSVEELEYEMAGITREISEIIVHNSETFHNANLSGSQVDKLTGAGKSAFHLIIKRDGSIERGVDLSSAGSHTPGHNTYSIGVLLVGGLESATPHADTLSKEFASKKGAGAITRNQYNSLYQIMRVFYTQYPGGQALGHEEVDGNHDDPGFEVRDYAYNLFNKTSLFTDEGEMKSEKSPDEINAPEDPDGPEVIDKDTEILDQKF